MRSNIKMLCVTNWNAVLELKTHPYYWVTEYGNHEQIYQAFNDTLRVADPDAIDVGMILHIDEIKLVARIKR